MECRHCGSFISTMFADTCGPGTPCAERQWARLVHRKQAEIDRLRSLLARYRDETPIGHQPHMIAHLVDEALGRQPNDQDQRGA